MNYGNMSAEHAYRPELSAEAFAQLEVDARESMGEIAALDTPREQVGGYVALYNRLIEIANTVAQLAQVAHHAAANTMADAGLKEVVTPHGRALVYGGRTYITKQPTEQA